MANIRVKPALDRISKELRRVLEQVEYYSGVDAKDATIIRYDAEDIAKMAAKIASIAKGSKAGNKIRRSRRSR